MDRRFEKVVVGTGAPAGVGRAVARRFARAGAAVALIGRDQEGLNEAKQEMESVGALVFTGGIGENSPEIREKICARLDWLGLELDKDASARKRDCLSPAKSLTEVRVMPTDEEWMIAAHTLRVTERIASGRKSER